MIRSVSSARGQQDDRDRAGLAQVPRQRQTVLARHHDVADHQVDALCAAPRLRRAGGVGDRKPRPSDIRRVVADRRFVVDQQGYAGAHIGHGSSIRE